MENSENVKIPITDPVKNNQVGYRVYNADKKRLQELFDSMSKQKPYYTAADFFKDVNTLAHAARFLSPTRTSDGTAGDPAAEVIALRNQVKELTASLQAARDQSGVPQSEMQALQKKIATMEETNKKLQDEIDKADKQPATDQPADQLTLNPQEGKMPDIMRAHERRKKAGMSSTLENFLSQLFLFTRKHSSSTELLND